MFVGHYAASLFAKSTKWGSIIPLWVLFLAAQLSDVLWGGFIIVGVERARLVAGVRGLAGLCLDFMPYTHSLVGAVTLAVATVLVCAIPLVLGQTLWEVVWNRNEPGRRTDLGPALLVGGVVASHWVLDTPVHRPDLHVYDSKIPIGAGLWDNHPVAAFVLEVALLAVAFWVCWWRTDKWSRPRVARRLGGLVAGLAVLQSLIAVLRLRNTFPFSLSASDQGAATWFAGLAVGTYLACSWCAGKLDPTAD